MEEAMTKTQLISIYSDGFFSDGTLQISNVGVKGILYTVYLRGQQIPGALLDLRTASASSLVPVCQANRPPLLFISYERSNVLSLQMMNFFKIIFFK